MWHKPVHPLFWFPLKLRHSSSGPFHDTGARYSFLPASTSLSAVPSSGKAKASPPVSGSGAPPLPSEKPQAQRLPHPDGLTEFPHAFALIFRTAPAPVQEWNLPFTTSPNLAIHSRSPGKAYSSAGAQTAPHHASTANKRHFIVRNPGVRFQANIREQPERSFFPALFPISRSRRHVSAAVIACAPFWQPPRIWSLSRQLWRRSGPSSPPCLPFFRQRF